MEHKVETVGKTVLHKLGITDEELAEILKQIEALEKGAEEEAEEEAEEVEEEAEKEGVSEEEVEKDTGLSEKDIEAIDEAVEDEWAVSDQQECEKLMCCSEGLK